MRAAQVYGYGDGDDDVELISVQDNIPVRQLHDLPPRVGVTQMLVRMEAVALAPGDCRVLSGHTKEIQGPPALPYIPAGDGCGIVVELPEQAAASLPFQVGDRVAFRLDEKKYNAMAEYALVPHTVACRVPENLTSVQAAALASAAPATVFAEYVQPGQRVVVLGAGGGVGAHLCQWLRTVRGAAYVVGVTSQPQILLQPPVSCHAAVDYTQQDVFSMKEYQSNPFDIMIDLAGGGYQQLQQAAALRQPSIVKPASVGGRFITLVPPVGPVYEMHSFWALWTVFVWPILRTVLISLFCWWKRSQLPSYTFAFCLSSDRTHLVQTLQAAAIAAGTDGPDPKLTAVVDPAGPFPFTTAGVRAAFRLQQSRHAHGKVVIDMTCLKD